MEVYLDNAATTRCYEEVKDIVIQTMMEDYGNPSSMHKKGVDAERYVKDAAKKISRLLKVKEKEIYFTSGGTEANNMAILGAAMANSRSGKHVIVSGVEHSSSSEPAAHLLEMGFSVSRLEVDEFGIVRLDDLKQTLREDTILVCCMYVNNEIGAREPIEEMASIIKNNSQAFFCVDAIQAFGKYHIYPARIGIDLLTASGHKIHGPKGTGFLYMRNGVKMHPLFFGGGQQMGVRPGTQNVPGIAGLGAAAELAYRDLDKKKADMYLLKAKLTEELCQIEDTKIIGPKGGEGAPHILNCSFKGVRSEVLLHALEERGIYVSAGSACASNKRREASATMKSLGIQAEYQESAIRFSLSEFTSEGDIYYTISVLRELLPMLRRYTRR